MWCSIIHVHACTWRRVQSSPAGPSRQPQWPHSAHRSHQFHQSCRVWAGGQSSRPKYELGGGGACSIRTYCSITIPVQRCVQTYTSVHVVEFKHIAHELKDRVSLATRKTEVIECLLTTKPTIHIQCAYIHVVTVYHVIVIVTRGAWADTGI